MADIFFICFKEDIKELKRLHPVNNKLIVFVLDPKSRYLLEKENIPYKEFSEFINNDEYKEKYGLSNILTKDWSKLSNDKELLKYNNYDFIGIPSLELFFLFCSIVDFVYIYERIFSKYKPQRVYLNKKFSDLTNLDISTWKIIHMNIDHYLIPLFKNKYKFEIFYLEPLVGIKKALEGEKYRLLHKFYRLISNPVYYTKVVIRLFYSAVRKRKGLTLSTIKKSSLQEGTLKPLVLFQFSGYFFDRLVNFLRYISLINDLSFLLVVYDIPNRALREIRQLGLQCICLDKYKCHKDKDFDEFINRNMTNITKKLNPDFFKIKGINFFNIFSHRWKQYCEIDLKKRYYKNILFAEQIFSAKKVDLLLTYADTSEPDLFYVYNAKARGIPTLSIQHGATNFEGHGDFQSDYCCVWGELSKRYYMDVYAKTTDQMSVTGNLTFDKYQNVKFEEKVSPQKVIGFIDSINNAIQGSYFYCAYYFKLIQILQGEKYKYKIRPRSFGNADLDILKVLTKEYEVDLTIDKSSSLVDFISQSDIVVTQNTSAAIEALYYRKPMIYNNICCPKDLLPLSKYGAAVSVYEFDELMPTIKKLLTDKEFVKKQLEAQKYFLELYCYKNDGRSSERIVGMINKIIKDQQRT